MANIYDVIVIGLGGVGSAAACHLASRGKHVLGLERYKAAHDRGSSHGSSRIIRQAYFENPNYVPLLLRAYELWEQLEQDTASSLLCSTGGLMLGVQESEVISGSLRSAKEHGLACELFDAGEIRRRFPPLHAKADEYAVYEKKAGFLRPESAILAHLQLAGRHSAALHFEEPVTGWTITPTGMVSVTTSQATYQSSSLILAPGAWAGDFLPSISLPLQVRRHVMAWFEPVGGIEPFLPDRFPVYVWQTDTQQVFYGFPATEVHDRGVKVAIHTGGAICAPDSIERSITEEDVQEIREQLSQRIPMLNGRFLNASTCMYTMTPDEHFVVSQHPEFSQVTIACGFSGHGFKFASVLGEVLADLAIHGTSRHKIDFLSPKRFGT